MKALRIALLPLLCGLLFSSPALPAEPEGALDQRVIGMWQDTGRTGDVMELLPDHTMKMYLTRQDGAKLNKHYLPATWSIEADSAFVISVTDPAGKQHQRKMSVSFENGDMVLEYEGRHDSTMHRIKALPEKYRW